MCEDLVHVNCTCAIQVTVVMTQQLCIDPTIQTCPLLCSVMIQRLPWKAPQVALRAWYLPPPLHHHPMLKVRGQVTREIFLSPTTECSKSLKLIKNWLSLGSR